VVAITEEDQNRPTCRGGGSLQTWRITGGTLVPLAKFEAEIDPSRTTLCSAHYFDVRGGLIAHGWYEQGVRFFDVSRPEQIRQVGFYIPQKNLMWGALFVPTDPTGEIVYALDTTRGIDILRFDRPDPSHAAPARFRRSSRRRPTAPARAPRRPAPAEARAARSGPTSASGSRRPLARPSRASACATASRSRTRRGSPRAACAPSSICRAAVTRVRARGASRAGRRLSYRVGTLAAGRSRTYTIDVRVRHRRGAVLLRARSFATGDFIARDDTARDRNTLGPPPGGVACGRPTTRWPRPTRA
jgi:hypothetical protein